MLSTQAYRRQQGAACGLAAAAIWAGWSVLTRSAMTTGLDGWDIAALRFGVAGVLLFPVVARRGLARERLGWVGLAVLISGLGAPYVLAAAGGLRVAPAYDQAALNPGCMPLFVAVIATVVAGERLSAAANGGLALILAGAVAILGGHAAADNATWSASRTLGDGLFLMASLLSAGFTVAMRRARLDGLHAAALVAVGSLLLYLPPYLAWHGLRLAHLSPADWVVQAVFQGVLVTIVSIVLYGRAVAVLGAGAGAAFGALVPVLAALFAIPLLGEWPGKADWLAIAVMSAGVYLASGGKLPATRRPGAVRGDGAGVRPESRSARGWRG